MKVYCAIDRNAFRKTVERFTHSIFAEVVKRKANSVYVRYGDDKEFDVLILHSQSYRNKNLRGKSLDVVVQSTPNSNPDFIAWAKLNHQGLIVQTLGS